MARIVRAIGRDELVNDDQKTWSRMTRTMFEHPIGFIVRSRHANFSEPISWSDDRFCNPSLNFSLHLCFNFVAVNPLIYQKATGLDLDFIARVCLSACWATVILLLFHCTLSSGIYCEGHEVVSHALWIPRVAVPRTNYPNTSTTLIFCTWPSFIYRDGRWDEVNAKNSVQ